MLIKIGSLEIRTGKDAKGSTSVQTNRDDIPVLPHRKPTVGAGLGVDVYVAPPKVEHTSPPPPTQSGLMLVQERKPHPMTKAIAWPTIPEDPMDQTRLSILVNKTDKWFREHNCVDVTTIKNYVEREGIVLYGDAREAMDMLQEIHCIDFNQLHPTVMRNIPAMYTAVFQAAKGEFNANDGWRF